MAVLAHLRATDRILEVGPGTGTYTALFDRRVAAVEAVEPAAAMRGYLRRRAAREAWQHTTITDGQLPGAVPVDGRFDAAVAIGVLNYVPDLRAALDDLAASVRPGGTVVVNVPAGTARGYARIEALGRRRIHRDRPASSA